MALPPYDPGADAHLDHTRKQPVRAVTMHRTIGSWPGDYSVGKNRHHDTPGTFNYLIGQDEGQWVQFYPPDVRCSHAAGSNRSGPGIEFSGQNGAPLTDWQIRAGGQVVTWLAFMYGLPLRLHEAPRIAVDGSLFSGFVNHAAVATEPRYQHYDYVTGDEFARMIGGTPPAPTPQRNEKPVFFVVIEGKHQGRRLCDSGSRVFHIDTKRAKQLQSQGVPGIDITSKEYVGITTWVQRVRQA